MLEDYSLIVTYWNVVYQVITFLAALLSSIFTAIGLYIIITKRKSVKGLFKLLTNISLQNTINELFQKLIKLNEYSADDDAYGKKEIVCILHEINGQIEGNQYLKDRFVKELELLNLYMSSPDQLSEPLKRGLVSMLREKLKNRNLDIYNDLARGENE